jgi:undecaprenyl-diphosphatase
VSSSRARWALAGGLAGFLVLAAAYRTDPVDSIDRWLAERLADGVPGPVESVALAASWLGGNTGLAILGAMLTAVLARERAWLDLAFLVAAFVGSQLAVTQLKEAFERPRPAYGSAVPLPETFSFPSGHAGGGVAAFGAAAILVSERLASPRARAAVWIVAGVLAASSGLSRVALNVHYASDVLAGWCFGLAWLAACVLGRDLLRRRAASRPR